jgi:crossover junction endodeoxyribonuclease RuvC
MRVLGVDPGLETTGYAVVELSGGAARLLEAGAIRTRAAELPERLRVLRDDLAEVLREFAPDVLGLESAYAAIRHPRSALQMAHARGVVCLAAADAGTPVRDISPAEVKSAVTGRGNASKGQVQRSVQALYALAEPPEPADVADAIAVATAIAYRAARGGP